MRKGLLALVAVPLLLSGGCNLFKNWQEFRSDQGGYTILMPGKPKYESQSMPLPMGGSLVIHMESVKVMNGVFGVGYADIPPGNGYSYSGGIEGMRQVNGGTVIKDEPFVMNGRGGREFEMSITKPRSGYAVGRMIVFNNRLYQILVVGSNYRLTDKDVQKFLNSFKLNKP